VGFPLRKSKFFDRVFYFSFTKLLLPLPAMLKTINILNKRARFDYEIIETYTAGIVLTGTEIKSIRLGKANITEGFCEFNNGELFAINTQIEEYAFGNQFNHRAKSERKLLLNKKELRSLERSVDTKGLTIIPLKLFTNEKGMAKLDIGLCRGKKTYDKRESLKDADSKRDLDRIKKEFRR
jgi:SsrA-binding protein